MVVSGGPDVDTIDGGGARVRGSVAAVALPLVVRSSPFRNNTSITTMRFRVRRQAAGIAHTRSAAAAMPRCSRTLRTADVPCAARPGASTCILEEWGPPWQRVAIREFPPSRTRPPGRLTATASEPYVSDCARVCWTRAERGCALSPLASALVFSPSFPRPSV